MLFNRMIVKDGRVVDADLTGKEAWIKFKEYAFSKGYTEKVIGDLAFSNKSGKIVRLRSAKNGKVEVYEEVKNTYCILDAGEDQDFKKDFRYAYQINAGGKNQILSLADPKEIKRRLDFVVQNMWNSYKLYYPNKTEQDYKSFWTEYLKEELQYYKKIIR